MPINGKSIVLGGVALKRGRIASSQKAMLELSRKLNPVLLKHGFLYNAPFEIVSGIIRYGSEFSDVCEVGSVDVKNSELPLAFEVDLEFLRMKSVDEVRNVYSGLLCKGLRQVADIYDLSTAALDEYEEMEKAT